MAHKRIRYPDGQISAKLDNFISPFKIKERINSYEDLIYVRSIVEAYQHLYKQPLSIFIPCMFGQRSDRRFEEEQSFDLKIIAGIINDCEFASVEVFDPHSDVTLALLNNSKKISSFEYVAQAVQKIQSCKEFNGSLVLVSPDAGAYKKVFDYGQQLELEVVAAVKHRDLEGNVDLTFMGDVNEKECLIVDDLCDGGYTFEVLGAKLKEQGAAWVSLYVSHGYFSKGFKKLGTVVDHIYCTNSVKDINLRDVGRDEGLVDYITQFKII